jgi:hypothetical protein
MDMRRKFLHLPEGSMMHGSRMNHSFDGNVDHGNGFCIYQGNTTETHSEDELVC